MSLPIISFFSYRSSSVSFSDGRRGQHLDVGSRARYWALLELFLWASVTDRLSPVILFAERALTTPIAVAACFCAVFPFDHLAVEFFHSNGELRFVRFFVFPLHFPGIHSLGSYQIFPPLFPVAFGRPCSRFANSFEEFIFFFVNPRGQAVSVDPFFLVLLLFCILSLSSPAFSSRPIYLFSSRLS